MRVCCFINIYRRKRMNFKTFALIIFFMAAAFSVFTADKKLRFAATGGLVLHNELLGQQLAGDTDAEPAGTAGGGFTIAYPVGHIDRPMSVEVGIANWYNIFPFDGRFAQTLRFGFSIRVFLNLLKAVRPYFTHDICSHFVWVSDRAGYGSTFGVLLGLGLDIPLPRKGKEAAGARRELFSIFFDVSYNTFHIARFEDAKEGAGYISGSIGFSWASAG